MDFSNDQEIAELLELSSDVIKSIQHAETQPAHTVGKSAIRKGNTSELRAAWEAEAQPAQVENKLEGHPEQAAQDHDSKIDKEGPQCRSNADGTPQPDELSGQVTAPPPDTTIGVNGTNGLEAALKKLERQGKGPGKGQMDRHTSQRDSSTVPGSKKGEGRRAKEQCSLPRPPTGDQLDPAHPETISCQTSAAGITGDNSSCTATPRFRRHRREFSIYWRHGQCVLAEWCNPVCAPVTPEPRAFKCTCGRCPRVCINCRNDSGDSEIRG
nr:V protein [Avian metaavulavirus 6]UQT69549.1 V protein [Avian metaavulavirus 6]